MFENGTQIYKAEDKANLLATKFERAHDLTIPIVPTPHSQDVERILDAFMTQHRRGSTPCPPVRIKEVRRGLSAIKRRTAPGEDGITPVLLRHLSTAAIAHLSSLFTSALTLGNFPSSWKQAKVIAIPKPRKPPTHPDSYRPISLLSAISKLLERLIARRLEQHAQQTNLIPNKQFGFRKRHSTVAQLARITDFVTHGYNLKKHTGMVLLDIEKAYDTIWPQGLLRKLIFYHFPAYLIHLIHSYLSGRTFTVVVDGARSSSRPQRAGLPQGAVLSPLLFTLYISDMPSLPHMHLALYADDTALLPQSWRVDTIVRRLRMAVTQLQMYFIRWRLQVNTSKTEAIFFTKMRPILPSHLRIENQDIPWTKEIKYLRLYLTPTLTFTTHTGRVAQVALGHLANLFPLLARDSTLTLATKLRLYLAVIRSTLTYGASVWCSTSATNIQTLQIVQNKYLRVFSASPKNTPISLLQSTLGVDLIRTYVHRLATTFYE